MAEALVSIVLDQLASILHQQMEEWVTFVGGVDEQLRKLNSNFLAIRAVLEDAEEREMKEKAVRDWLEKLKDSCYEIDNVLDEWNTWIGKIQAKGVGIECASKLSRKVPSSLIPSFHYFCCRRVIFLHNVALKIQNLNRALDVIAEERTRFNFNLMKEDTSKRERQMATSLVDVSKIHGRDEDKNTLINYLLNESQESTIPIISIVGMGGIGKTTLAQLVFNDNEVKKHFEKRIWVCVSEPFDKMRVAKAILESLTNVASNLVELETVLNTINLHTKDKKYLLVLDDVWTEDSQSWEQLTQSLKCGSSRGSRILVTTRKENVANNMGTTNMILLDTLLENECRSLFTQVAFSRMTKEDSEKLENIGKEIVRKCNGLPLAVKTLGSFLCYKKDTKEWQRILDNELWELDQGVQGGIFPPLLLSYYDLPSQVRKCFSYCAIFPKDYKIEKDKLIKLWMAQNYLLIEGRDDMELIGEEFFEYLVVRSFFQNFEKDEYNGSIITCKMHEIVHDFTQFLTKNECSIVEINVLKKPKLKYFKKARHSMIMLDWSLRSFPISIFNEKILRSLMIQRRKDFVLVKDLSKLFDQLTCLRTLDLSDGSLNVLPKEIKKLIHLRYLDLSHNGITELPETLCELYNLQTLDLSYCDRLQQLPQAMEKLINLRHVINIGNSSLRYMPKGIERLICLRTLNLFVVSIDEYDRKGCTLECMKNLNHIGGYLCIDLGGRVTTVEEAEKAELQNKMNLCHLKLAFRGYRANVEKIDEHLEALKPPLSLERLEISRYIGNSFFPSWLLSLTNLRMLTLEYCEMSEHLPPLGNLSSLESLYIMGMPRVRRVGNEFFGIKSDSTPPSSSVIVFPKLKSLSFDTMREWEEWDYGITSDGDDVKFMPYICSLSITNCPKLKALPDCLLWNKKLEKLQFHRCPMLEEHYGTTSTLEEMRIILKKHFGKVTKKGSEKLVIAEKMNNAVVELE